jgi:molybdopterin molybdotransferase
MSSPHSIFCDDYDPNSLALEAAQARILSAMSMPKTTEWVPLRQSLHRVLGNDILAPFAVPGHPHSAMDGYALHQDDLSPGVKELPVVGTSAAGHPYQEALKPGETIRIMTGAVIPAGAAAVIMQERVTRQPGHISIAADHLPQAGANIRQAGEDLAAGTLALAKGRRLRPADLGLMASLGLTEVPVYPKLRVAFFSTGDELCSLGQTPQLGQVFDSNRYSLFGMLESMGVDWHDLGVARDTPEALHRVFEHADAVADVIISTGGVSVGDADYVKDLLEHFGRTVFWKIAIKPGRPFAYGQFRRGAHFFGLPGNPVAVMVTFAQLVRPAIERLQGITEPALPLRLSAVTQTPLKKTPGRAEFQRGILKRGPQGYEVYPTGEQSSGMLSSMSLANCFIYLPTDSGRVEAGSIVEVEPFHEGL